MLDHALLCDQVSETELLLLLLIRSEKILRMLRVDRKIAEHSHAIQNMPATSRDSRRPAERTRNEMRTHTQHNRYPAANDLFGHLERASSSV